MEKNLLNSHHLNGTADKQRPVSPSDAGLVLAGAGEPLPLNPIIYSVFLLQLPEEVLKSD